MMKMVEFVKQAMAEPSKFLPGGKVIAAYGAMAQSLTVASVEVPSIDALMPILEQLNALGQEIEVIPAEKMEVILPKLEETIAQLAGS